jgi:hypothetical protein
MPPIPHVLPQDSRFENTLSLEVLLGAFSQVLPAAQSAAEMGLS